MQSAKDSAHPKLWRKPFDHEQKAVKPGKVTIDRERCKGCGYCVEFCPRDALVTSEELGPKGYTLAKVADTNKCLGCGLCEIICPEFAIRLEQGEDNK
jgi:2-oxoglutarate ferredoxin oxidoreductase subunit delta